MTSKNETDLFNRARRIETIVDRVYRENAACIDLALDELRQNPGRSDAAIAKAVAMRLYRDDQS